MATKKENTTPKTRLNKESRKIINKFLEEAMNNHFDALERKLPTRETALFAFKKAIDKKYPESEMGVLAKWSVGTLAESVGCTLYFDNMEIPQANCMVKELAKLHGEDSFRKSTESNRMFITFTMKNFKDRIFHKHVKGYGQVDLSFSLANEMEKSQYLAILIFHADCCRLAALRKEREDAYHALIYRTVFFEDLMEAWPEISVLANDVNIRMPERYPVRFNSNVMKIIHEDFRERGVVGSFTDIDKVE